MTREECEEYEGRGYQRHHCRLTGRVEWTDDCGYCKCMTAALKEYYAPYLQARNEMLDVELLRITHSNDTVKEETDAD